MFIIAPFKHEIFRTYNILLFLIHRRIIANNKTCPVTSSKYSFCAKTFQNILRMNNMPVKILENFDFQFLYELFDTIYLIQHFQCCVSKSPFLFIRTILLLISDHDL